MKVRRTVTCILIAIAFLIPTSLILLPLARPVAGFPAIDPVASDYIFYDDFEGTGALGWPTWNANPVYTVTYSTEYAFHEAKSAKFAAHDANTRQILRGFVNDSDTRNEQIIIECMFRDNASIITQNPLVRAQLWIANSAGSWVGLGVQVNNSQRLFSYWFSDGGAGLVNQTTGIERTTGWHNLKVMLVSHTDYFLFIDNEWIGNITLADATGMEWYGFNVYGPDPDVSGDFYIDQFYVYRGWQDQIWKRAALAIDDVETWNSYLAIEPSIIYESGTWKMWYDGINVSATNIGTLCYATSNDGYTWTDYPANPIVSFGTGYRPFVTKIGSTYYCYNTYEAGSYGDKHFKVRTSANGITWNAAVDTNLGCGAVEGDWDHVLLGNIFVWKESTTWYALYEAASNATFWRLGLATSWDGITWTKNAANPVTPSDMVAGGPDLHKIGSTYYLFCHGILTNWVNNKPTDIYLLQSTDLVTWERTDFFSQFTRLIGSNLEDPQIADVSYCSADGKNILAFEGTVDGTDEGKIWIAESDYTLEQIAAGQILQSGPPHLLGDIGATTNITTAGDIFWYSGINAMKGSYTDNLTLTTTSDINITITAMSDESRAWVGNPGTGDPTVTFTLYNLLPETKYYVKVDGYTIETIESDASGVLSFAYSSPWSSHQFEVTTSMYDATIQPLVNLILFAFALGVVVGPMAWVVELTKLKKVPTIDQVINVVIFIIVGLSSVGLVYGLV
jgi:hypothetical protein